MSARVRELAVRRYPALSIHLEKLEVATRSALTVAIGAAVLYWAGRTDLTMYVMFGAFTAVYGSNERYRVRIRSVTAGGVGILAAIAVGMVLSRYQVGNVWLVAVAALMLVPGCLLTAAFQLVPAQPFFQMIALTGCASIPVATEGRLRLAVAVGSVALAWTLTMAGWLLRRRSNTSAGPLRDVLFKTLQREPEFRPGAVADWQVWATVLRNVLAVVTAGLIAVGANGGRPYWAMIVTVATLPPTWMPHRFGRVAQRITGTVVGVLLAGALLSAHLPLGAALSVIVVSQFMIELTVIRLYAVACVFITTLVFTAQSLALPGAQHYLPERLLETAIGCVVAVSYMSATVWLRRLRRNEQPS
ncbi:FUSC family protein [Tsukamurella sp. 8F]|uniref:FUSC family protein n=1 Tax=unclassified Tsukamurella TaxID=2633480 RepID=UPI0023B8DB2D|nr:MULTISPECIES: FUSC family protein [unclassified Tsukamurella]MDF0529221.1 FUSC family protein [Tsukamurella sp. 8J]MDF0585406.1 FUSC family protein [Tsukamurella sp. 8F]